MKELSEEQCLEALYGGISPSKIYAPSIQKQYNEYAVKLGLEQMPDKPEFSGEWFMPQEYKDLDVVEYFASKATTEDEIERVALELDLFISSGNENLLRYAIYLGSIIYEQNVVVGVGRGSSVSCYLFYLCKIHKCNSIFYKLDPYDFFKIKE